jgi:hypothetical protein
MKPSHTYEAGQLSAVNPKTVLLVQRGRVDHGAAPGPGLSVIRLGRISVADRHVTLQGSAIRVPLI